MRAIPHTDALETTRVAKERMGHQLRQYGLDANADPLAVAAEARERRMIVGELAEKRNELARAGDGLGEEALRQEADSISPDGTSTPDGVLPGRSTTAAGRPVALS